MVQIRNIVRSNPQSAFSQVAPAAGGGFNLLAAAMEEGYNALKPEAERILSKRGAALGKEMAQGQMVGRDRVRAIVGGDYNDSLARTESGGNYQAQNSEGYFGKYQWGEARLADYNRATGQNITKDQFLGNKDIQETAQGWHNADIDANLGDLVGKTVKGITMTPYALRAAAHLGGQEGARKFVESGGAFDPQDSNGKSLSDYARTHGQAGGSGGVEYTPPTMLMDADGKLQARMFSPFSDPMLQMANAATVAAYTSEIMVKGVDDLMGLSQQFALDPDGFKAATDGYIKDIVGKAPAAMRGDVRASLEKTAQQRLLGMAQEKFRDTQQRAANANRALIDRWTDNYAQAVAMGDPTAIDSSRSELESALRLRETLPGLAWTPEDSANVLIQGMDKGRSIQTARAKEQSEKVKDALTLMGNAAKNFQSSPNEQMVLDPAVQAMHPELVSETLALLTVRDQMGALKQLPVAEQRKAAADFKAQPVEAQWQIDISKALDSTVDAQAKAWKADPIAQAGAVLLAKPPALPTPEQAMARPQSVAEALTARVAYGKQLQAQGYTDFAPVFTDQEAQSYGALFGKDVPPEIKLEMATAIVAAAGPDARQVFKELNSDDPVTMLSGQLLARGGDRTTALLAMQGAAMMREGLKQPPAKSKMAEVDADIASAFAAIPNSEKAQGDVMELARAIYVAGAAPNGETDEQEKTRMAKAVNMALGQTTAKNGDVLGGVQTVGGAPVLLPPGMSGAKLEAAIERTLRAAAGPTLAMGGASNPAPDGKMQEATQTDTGRRIDYKSGSVPMLGGEPLAPKHMNKIVLIPLGGTSYRMALKYQSGEMTDLRDQNGNAFVFDAQKLVSP